MVLVFDLRLGESRFKGDGPIDGLLAPVDESLLNESGESAQDIGLKGRGLGLVFVPPVGQDAQPFELPGLPGNPSLGEIVAELPQLGGGRRLLVCLELAGDFLLNRQAVAVPAGHIGRAETPQRLEAENDVLECLVKRVADVHVAVGERRPVVKDKGRGGGAILLDGVVEADLLPVRETGRLTLHEIRPHREFGSRKLKRVFQFMGHSGKSA